MDRRGQEMPGLLGGSVTLALPGLTTYLLDRDDSPVVLSFVQIEAITGRPLPGSARRHPAAPALHMPIDPFEVTAGQADVVIVPVLPNLIDEGSRSTLQDCHTDPGTTTLPTKSADRFERGPDALARDRDHHGGGPEGSSTHRWERRRPPTIATQSKSPREV